VEGVDGGGLVLVGPGSEWLWLAVAGLFLGTTFVAIYRQMRLERHAAAVDQLKRLDEEWLGSERMARMRVAALRAIRDGTPFEEIPPRVLDIADFWDGVGHLVRSGHLEAQLVRQQRSQSIRMWWAWIRPIVETERRVREAPWIAENFEWLARRMAALDRSAGRTTAFDAAYAARVLPMMLAYNEDMVALAEECRRSPGEGSDGGAGGAAAAAASPAPRHGTPRPRGSSARSEAS
jgi:hypothetical protein